MSSRRTQVAIAGAIALGVLAVMVTFAACSGCGKQRAQSPNAVAPDGAAIAVVASATTDVDAAVVDEPVLWAAAANDGDQEDFAVLAVHAGAIGLIEGASDPAKKRTALRAMAFAEGWAQLPYLAKTAGAKNDEEAKLALDSILELATRPRRAEDVEDADELKEGCDTLVGIAKDTSRARNRRVPTLRALRMMPCPKAELPTDVDSK